MIVLVRNIALFFLLSLFPLSLSAGTSRLELHQADNFEIVLAEGPDTTFVTGSVIFENEDGFYYCDSAIWIKGVNLFLKGNVIIDGKKQHVIADSIDYNLVSGDVLALGSRVEIWSYDDSILAVGDYAFYRGEDSLFVMENRPTLFLNYPDSSNLVEIIADEVRFSRGGNRAEAEGDVTINSEEFSSSSGCAVMLMDENLLDLTVKPVAHQGNSEIKGEVIAITRENGMIRQIDVIDSAEADLIDVIDTVTDWTDRSTISGNRILMEFEAGELSRVSCFGQSYSSYFPSARGKEENSQNKVSGDTILLHISDQELTAVEVFGGAVGTYLSEKPVQSDSATVMATDTVEYEAAYLRYDIKDSLITMNRAGQVRSGQMALDAYRIEYDTRAQLVKAYSAKVTTDSSKVDSSSTSELQPNEIPVALHDHNDIIYGDYLEYSMETQKGRILKSKSKYETGFFYGRDVHRQSTNILYLVDGKYTTCDADEPHYHFSSKNLKIIENDRLIARPVVFNIGRIPIFALPYYVFPLKKGRHSGMLPFTIGNIEQGDRFIRNVGYYVAGSEYWDWQGAVDFFEKDSRLNFYSRFSYNKRYQYSGSVRGNFGRSTPFSFDTGEEFRTNRWSFEANHKQQISPSLKIDAFGKIQSDATFFNDFSTNLKNRLDRDITSKFNFTKRFSRTVSLSGSATQVENIDQRSRVTNLPTMNLLLPTIRPFGEGGRDETGKLKQKWYNNITVRYTPSFRNFSSRITVDSLFNMTTDTLTVTDTVSGVVDTTITTSADTVSFRSRKKYARIDHNPSLNLPTMRFGNVLRLTPTVRYSETWYKIRKSDQSIAAGIEPTTFRAYSYSLGASLTTDLYGTVYPNLFGLTGLRQVITPSLSYSFAPKIDKIPKVRAFAGGGPGNARKSQVLGINLRQVYQAKVNSGGVEKSLELISINSSTSYDFENEERQFSNLNTTFRSFVLPKVNLDGSMTHSLYKEGTNELDILSPVLESFRVNANLTLAGNRFLFDDIVQSGIPLGADSASNVAPSSVASSVGRRGWSLRANYSYSQSGRGNRFIKSSFVRLSLSFNLTQSTAVTYNQYYDFGRSRTVNSQINITRRLHAWTGRLFWIPVGSNNGFGFRLFVTAIPAIKFDNSQSPVSSNIFDDLR